MISFERRGAIKTFSKLLAEVAPSGPGAKPVPSWRNDWEYGGGTVPPSTHSRLTGLNYLVPYLIPGTWYRDGSS